MLFSDLTPNQMRDKYSHLHIMQYGANIFQRLSQVKKKLFYERKVETFHILFSGLFFLKTSKRWIKLTSWNTKPFVYVDISFKPLKTLKSIRNFFQWNSLIYNTFSIQILHT